MEKNNDFIKTVQKRIGGYRFRNPKLLRQAFVRKSYTEEHSGENNEVLEFIGDKVLDVAVIRYLTKKYGNNPYYYDENSIYFRPNEGQKEFKCKLVEGALTKLKQKMVEKTALASRIDYLGLAEFLIVGKTDKSNNILQEPSVKEDLFEAILGAVALDSNWDFEKIQEVVEVMLMPESFLENGGEADYVGLIFEWADKKGEFIPDFNYPNYSYSGSLWVHFTDDYKCQVPRDVTDWHFDNLKYTCQLNLFGRPPYFEAYGRSKHEARKEVCKLAYQYLESKGELLGIVDEIENPNFEDAIGQLEILARRGYFEIPKYAYSESHDENGNPVWHVECHIKGINRFSFANGSSKKQVKKEAAYQMLMFLLEHK